jgi:hypothetical protein
MCKDLKRDMILLHRSIVMKIQFLPPEMNKNQLRNTLASLLGQEGAKVGNGELKTIFRKDLKLTITYASKFWITILMLIMT